MRSLFPWRRWRAARRKFSQYHRPLRLEPLEGRYAPAILTVNSLADGPINWADSTVTLRDAIEAANEDVGVSPGGPAGNGADEIRFQAGLTGTIVLNQGQLGLRSDLTITGPGAGLLTISGNNAGGRVFDVTDFTATVIIVTISGLTITAGQAPTSDGGGILNRENLAVQNCTITGNTARDQGGGIYNSDTGTLLVLNSTISGNQATGIGGTQTPVGGGIVNLGALTLRNSTVNGNSAKVGGGLYITSGLIQNSTISGNSTFGEGSIQGGGIYISGGALTVQNSTVTQNLADSGGHGGQEGGGIYISSGAVVLHNTIVADNFHGNSAPGDDDILLDPTGSLTGTYNLIGTGRSGGLTDGIDGNKVAVVDPKLGPLADNGGPTKTHALLGGSPAFNAGSNTQAPNFSNFDQRGSGFPRIASGTVDIGAFEAQPISLVVDTDADEADGNIGPGHLSLREAINLTNANAAGGTITFSPSFFNTPRQIALSLGELLIADDVTITGPGAKLLTVNGNLASRVFDVDDSDADFLSVVAISGLTVTGANASGILNQENLTITSSTIRDNFGGNPALAFGNNAGGISNRGTLTVLSSTISGNRSQGQRASGGGIVSTLGTLTVVNSTISGNASDNDGGGISFLTGTLTIRNSTITGNTADNNKNDIGAGGGILFSDATVTLHNTIVAGNARLTSTLFSFIDDISPVNGSVSSTSFNNLIGTGGSGGLVNGTNGNQVGVANVKLGALADNRGPTMTHALLTGSPAIDAGSNAQTQASLTTDQRGFVRIFNTTVDIGAFELQPLHPWHNDAKAEDVNNDNHIAPNDALAIINYLNAFGAGAVPPGALIGQPYGFLDVTANDFVAPNDALVVINDINAFGSAEGEGGGQTASGSQASEVEGRKSEIGVEPAAGDNWLALVALDMASQEKASLEKRRQWQGG